VALGGAGALIFPRGFASHHRVAVGRANAQHMLGCELTADHAKPIAWVTHG